MCIKKLVSRLVRKYGTRDPFEMVRGNECDPGPLSLWKVSVAFLSILSAE